MSPFKSPPAIPFPSGTVFSPPRWLGHNFKRRNTMDNNRSNKNNKQRNNDRDNQQQRESERR